MKFVSRVRFQAFSALGGDFTEVCERHRSRNRRGDVIFIVEKPWKHTLGTLGREITPPCEITPGGCEITAPCEITPPPAKSRPSCPQTLKWHDRVTVTLTPAPPGRPLRECPLRPRAVRGKPGVVGRHAAAAPFHSQRSAPWYVRGSSALMRCCHAQKTQDRFNTTCHVQTHIHKGNYMVTFHDGCARLAECRAHAASSV